MLAITWVANASLISMASTSPTRQPERASTFSVEGTGPRPIMCGGARARRPQAGGRGRLRGGGPGAGAKEGGGPARRGGRDDPRARGEPVALDGLARGDDDRARAVGQRRRGARRHDAVGLERRLEL